MKLRYVFSESPYAVALSREYLMSRCSFCAGDRHALGTSQMCKCKSVVYCRDTCAEDDRVSHEFECMAFAQGKLPGRTETAHLGVRLIGRTVARYRTDKGRVVLTNNFPSHTCKDRHFDDLMTHSFDLRLSASHEEAYREIKKAFYDFFANTPLSSTPRSQLRKFFYRLCINGFSLNVRLGNEPDSSDELGESVYLNASRFNHSCRPTCLYRFDGSRIVIEYIDYNNNDDNDDKVGDGDHRKQFSKEQIENMTLQYGFGGYYCYDASCPLTAQRRISLRSRYFFECRCELCVDKTKDRLQLHAAPVECAVCQSPYVWRPPRLFGSAKLKRTCQCSKGSQTEESKTAAIMFGKDGSRKIKDLGREWTRTMKRTDKLMNTKNILRACLPLLQRADKFWHPNFNLRLGQLHEKIFAACQNVLVSDGGVTFLGSEEDLDLMLRCGETMLTIYERYFEPYMLPIASYAADLAALYELRSTSTEDAERSQHWFNFAIKMWTERGDLECARHIAQRIGNAYVKWSQPEQMVEEGPVAEEELAL